MFTLDTLYNTGKAGMTTALTADELETAVLALSAVIALNIAAAVSHHMTDPDQLREQAEEEAFDKVETATLKQISKNADQLAAQLAPTLAADWMQHTRARYMSYVGTGKIPALLDATAQDVTPAPVMPIVAVQPKPKNAPLWAGLFNTVTGKGRKFQSATVTPAPAVVDEPKPTDAKTEPPPADTSFPEAPNP
jgi:hypothetical protein